MSYDLIVIGAGPGGYECAIRASQLGMKVGCVEKRDALGGTCLNVGCIPSKALLHASEVYDELGHLDPMGISVSNVALDLPKMMGFKQEAIDGNTKGIEFLFKKNKIDWLKGTGKILGTGKVEVTAADGSAAVHETKNIVIATGSDVAQLPGITVDEDTIVSSTGALDLKAVPERLLVIGAGVIGLELGSVWKRLGSKVTVVEYLDHVLPGMDGEVSKTFGRILKKQKFDLKLGHKVSGVEKTSSGLAVSIEPAAGGDVQVIEADVVLVSIGRVAYTDGLGCKDVGIETDTRGRVVIDDQFATSLAGVYAIGDVVVGPMLAHKAMEEGSVLAEKLDGQMPHINHDAIPGVVYTHPEVASVGKTVEQLKAEGVEVNVGKFPFTANGRAKANRTTDGFVKIIADKNTDAVLGVHIIGAGAGEMIHEAVSVIEFGGSSEDIARTCHAHPTMSEAIKEAAMDVTGSPIHM
ncbi:MAG: dihydrolipoyl dehydrogenase [Parvibaculaceae bacterium]|nr:dihydrolipoyl dehydrogenase [Parvibaculaceae bacterium]